MVDEILRQAVEGISDIITNPGKINVDFADIKAIMADAGSALMGIGYAAGEGRAENAALQAINSPLLEISINGAKGVLFSVAGSEDLGIQEIQSIAKIITESIDKDAKVIWGKTQDDKLKKGEIRVTVIATGFPNSGSRKSIFQAKQGMVASGGRTEEEKEDDLIIEEEVKEKKPSKKEEVKEIRNSIPTAEDFEELEKKEKESIEIVDGDDFEEGEDDWSAVPAFLRRKK